MEVKLDHQAVMAIGHIENHSGLRALPRNSEFIARNDEGEAKLRVVTDSKGNRSLYLSVEDNPSLDGAAQKVAFLSQTLAERDFLLSRTTEGHNAVGQSSQALVRFAMLGYAAPECAPRDMVDLACCERTYASAPEHLRSVMLPVLERWRREVREMEAGR